LLKRHGVHVRPGQSSIYSQPGRRISHFECIETALKFVEARPQLAKLIFLHTGRHILETSIIISGSAIQIIGASNGLELNIMNSVIIENQRETVVREFFY
jgi:hypothetical protein